jgi:hypothetical protein
MTAVITDRLNTPDTIELVREQIAAILYYEMANQYTLAVADEDPVSDDYLTTVFVENDEPLNFVESDNPLFPLINVSVDREGRASKDSSASVNYRKNKGTIFIDCYQTGNFDGNFAGRKATIKAWKLARCVRAILESDEYTYLKLRSLVTGHEITRRQAFVPDMQNSALKVVVVRLELDVTYDQAAPITTGPELEIITVKIDDETGQIQG